MIDNSLYITIDKLKEQLEESQKELNRIAMISHNRGHKIREQREELESYKEQCTGNHSDPEDCPTWHDWCNCGGFLTEHIQQLKEQLEWEVALKQALLERQEEWAREMRDLKEQLEEARGKRK